MVLDQTPARILVTGSRSLDIRRYDHPGYLLRERCRSALSAFRLSLENQVARLAVTDTGLRPFVVVHGGATFGADAWATQWVFSAWFAQKFSREVAHVERWAAQWRGPGGQFRKWAGMERNSDMVNSMDPEQPHVVIACWDGKSKGTEDCMNKAIAAGLTVTRCFE